MPFIGADDQINLFQKDQINKLNSEVKCKLAPSAIHGIGVFAIFDIKKGQKLYCIPPSMNRVFYTVSWSNLNKLWPEVKELILSRWPSIINGSLFLHPNDEVWLASWINHSDSPNYDQESDTAIKDIKAGEEITESYRIMDNAEKIYPFLRSRV